MNSLILGVLLCFAVDSGTFFQGMKLVLSWAGGAGFLLYRGIQIIQVHKLGFYNSQQRYSLHQYKLFINIRYYRFPTNQMILVWQFVMSLFFLQHYNLANFIFYSG